MLRVLMVLEDYGELVFVQTVLKKIGFDVDAIQNPRLFEDSLITMNPDVLIMTAFGKRVRGLELSRQLRNARQTPKILLLHSVGQAPEPDPLIGGWLQSPAGAVDLLSALADIAGIDKESLHDKFQKLRLREDPNSEPVRTLKSSLVPSSVSDGERRERYRKFLSEAPPKEHGFAIRKVQEFVKALRTEEEATDKMDLENERKAFVEHLFKKKL